MAVKGSEIRFGVEIECYVPVGTRGMSAGRYHRGLQINDSPRGWNGQSDGSLNSTKIVDGERYRPIEVVSPILKGEDGLGQIFYMVEMLQAAGAITDSRCGIHVHVEGKGLQAESERLAFVHEFKAFEDVFMGLNGDKMQQRMGNHYCKMSSEWADGYTYQDRYRTLNMTNLVQGRKGTVEFRMFASLIDVEFIVTAVYMAVAIVAGWSRVDFGQTAEITRMSRVEKSRIFVQRYWSRIENLILGDESTEDVQNVLFERLARVNM
jgi:hypothetical protein